MQNRQNRQNSRPPYENRDIGKIPRRRFLLYILVTPKHPMGQRVFVSFDVSPVGYLAHEFSVVV